MLDVRFQTCGLRGGLGDADAETSAGRTANGSPLWAKREDAEGQKEGEELSSLGQ